MQYIGIVHRVCYPGYDGFSQGFIILLFSYMICILSILDSSQPFSWARDSRHTAASRHLHTSHRLSLLLYAGARACAHVTRPKSVERRGYRTRHETRESSLERAHTRATALAHDGTTAHGLAQHSDTAPKVPIPQQFHRLQTPIMALLTGP